MREFYSIHTLYPPPALEAELIALGLYDYEYREQPHPSGKVDFMLRLRLPTDDNRLPAILELAQQYGLMGGYVTEYSVDDYANADWLEAEIVSRIGYPKPESNWQEFTYDSNYPDFCSKCGAGFVQTSPFRFARSHERGKTVAFCSPGWVYDALFVRAEVKEELIAQGIQGIDYLPAIEAGSKEPFEDVIQVLFNNVLEPALLNPEDFSCEVCARCQRQKWLSWHRVKRFRRASFDDQLDMVLTHEWFGSGGLAFRKILVSRRFAELLQERRWRGLRLNPVILE